MLGRKAPCAHMIRSIRSSSSRARSSSMVGRRRNSANASRTTSGVTPLFPTSAPASAPSFKFVASRALAAPGYSRPPTRDRRLMACTNSASASAPSSARPSPFPPAPNQADCPTRPLAGQGLCNNPTARVEWAGPLLCVLASAITRMSGVGLRWAGRLKCALGSEHRRKQRLVRGCHVQPRRSGSQRCSKPS